MTQAATDTVSDPTVLDDTAPSESPHRRRRAPDRRVLNRAALGLGRKSKTLSIEKLRRRRREGLPPVVAALAPVSDVLDVDASDEVVIERPRVRGDCMDAPRPCPWVACKYHLYLDVDPKHGSIKFNFPDLEPWELRETCALDVAGPPDDPRPRHLVTVGELMNVTRERVRQIEQRAMRRARADETGALASASELLEDGEELDESATLDEDDEL